MRYFKKIYGWTTTATIDSRKLRENQFGKNVAYCSTEVYSQQHYSSSDLRVDFCCKNNLYDFLPLQNGFSKECEKIILAPDPDREGESIAWHILEVLKIKKAIKSSTKVERVVFNAITKNSVLEAIKKPREIDMNLALD